jgi:hypothetical protein
MRQGRVMSWFLVGVVLGVVVSRLAKSLR